MTWLDTADKVCSVIGATAGIIGVAVSAGLRRPSIPWRASRVQLAITIAAVAALVTGLAVLTYLHTSPVGTALAVGSVVVGLAAVVGSMVFRPAAVNPPSGTPVINRPRDGAQITGWQCPVQGRLNPPATADGGRSVALLVRPMTGAAWWVQHFPTTVDGQFDGQVILGEEGGAGVGVSFQIVAAVVERGSMRPGERLFELPAASRLCKVTVRRTR